MHVLSASGLGHGFDGRNLFDDLSFGLTSDDAIAIVGPNGSGKTTLLAILAGLVQPDVGQVTINTAARIVHLPQQPATPGATTAMAAATTIIGVADHEAARLLDHFDVDPEVPLERLSGGQQRRVALVATLVAPSDLLILDEPTNHLDADAIDRLEDHLGNRAGGLALVSHDRYLLQRLTTRLLDLNDTPTWVEGNYADVLAARVQRCQQRDRAAQVRRNQLRRELAWLQRAPKARGTKASFRIDQAHRLQAEHAADGSAESALQLPTGRRRLGNKVLEVTDLTVNHGDHTVLSGVNLVVGPGERLGLVGRNGAGKTSLLATLDGELASSRGTIEWGQTVQRALYRQQERTTPVATRVIDTITEIAEWVPLADGSRLPAGRLAERFGFDDRLQYAAVNDLSGGERRRLALLHLLVAAPNVIVLDEPTNDLDLDTLRALEDHLDGFDGTLVIASHDRFLLDRLTDRLVAVHEGRLTEVADWDAYRRLLDTSDKAVRPPGPSQDRRTDGNRDRQQRHREARALTQRMDRLTTQVAKLEGQLVEVGSDVAKATAIHADLAQVQAQLNDVEDAWLDATT